MEKYKRGLKEPAKALRKSMTDAEKALWRKVRRKQVYGLQFYRQKPLLSFIVDFYCPQAKLVIELDGAQHFKPDHQLKDQARNGQLAALGLRVLRFDNLQVLKEMDAVMAVIWREVGVAVNTMEIPPQPPFFKGGEKKAVDIAADGLVHGQQPEFLGAIAFQPWHQHNTSRWGFYKKSSCHSLNSKPFMAPI